MKRIENDIGRMLVPHPNGELLLTSCVIRRRLCLLPGLDDAAAVTGMRLRHRAFSGRLMVYRFQRIGL